MSRVKTFTAGGKLFPSDLNNIQDQYESSYSNYKFLTAIVGRNTGSLTSGTQYVVGDSDMDAVNNSNAVALRSFYLPTGFDAGSVREVKLIVHISTFLVATPASPTNVTFGFATATMASSSSSPFVGSISSEASGIINSIGLERSELILGPVNISNTTPRVIYLSPNVTQTLNICVNADVYYYQQ